MNLYYKDFELFYLIKKVSGKMDQIDKKIVRELQLNAKISMKELAEIVHLSAPAVIERVRKLEEQQIIEGYHASVALKKCIVNACDYFVRVKGL